MGRGAYEAVRRLGGADWPYPGKPTTVVTARPLPDPPPGVEARSGDMAGVAAELEGRGHRRVWIEGGGRVIPARIDGDPFPASAWTGPMRWMGTSQRQCGPV